MSRQPVVTMLMCNFIVIVVSFLKVTWEPFAICDEAAVLFDASSSSSYSFNKKLTCATKYNGT